jgi:hypothetical protein
MLNQPVGNTPVANRLNALLPQNLAQGYYVRPEQGTSRTRHPWDEFKTIMDYIELRMKSGTEPREWIEGDVRAITQEYSFPEASEIDTSRNPG